MSTVPTTFAGGERLFHATYIPARYTVRPVRHGHIEVAPARRHYLW